MLKLLQFIHLRMSAGSGMYPPEEHLLLQDSLLADCEEPQAVPPPQWAYRWIPSPMSYSGHPVRPPGHFYLYLDIPDVKYVGRFDDEDTARKVVAALNTANGSGRIDWIVRHETGEQHTFRAAAPELINCEHCGQEDDAHLCPSQKAAVDLLVERGVDLENCFREYRSLFQGLKSIEEIVGFPRTKPGEVDLKALAAHIATLMARISTLTQDLKP